MKNKSQLQPFITRSKNPKFQAVIQAINHLQTTYDPNHISYFLLQKTQQQSNLNLGLINQALNPQGYFVVNDQFISPEQKILGQSIQEYKLPITFYSRYNQQTFQARSTNSYLQSGFTYNNGANNPYQRFMNTYEKWSNPKKLIPILLFQKDTQTKIPADYFEDDTWLCFNNSLPQELPF